MADVITLASVYEKNKLAGSAAHIVVLEIDEVDGAGNVIQTHRICNNDEPMTIDGNTFVAIPFAITAKYEAGGLPEVAITIQDALGAFRDLMREYSGGVGFPVRVIGVLATDAATSEIVVVENYKIMHTSTAGVSVTVTIGDRNVLNDRWPNRIQRQERCPWVFKGEYCGYAGALSTCDYTLQGANGCASHDNTANFGGFPGILPRNFTA